MKSITILSQLLSIAALLFFSPVANAHSTILIEQTVGNYKATMDFFGDAAFEQEAVGLTFRLFTVPSGDIVGFTDATVNITKEGGEALFSGTIEKPEEVPVYAGWLRYTFPSEGKYIVTVNFKQDNQSLIEVVFPSLSVLANTNETGPQPIPINTPDTTNKLFKPVAYAVLGVILICGLIYVTRKK
jgi:hypothetical protein